MVCATQRAAQCETSAGGVSARSRAQPDLRRASPVEQGPPSAARANWNSRPGPVGGDRPVQGKLEIAAATLQSKRPAKSS